MASMQVAFWVIAMLVLLPETWAAVRAAAANRLHSLPIYIDDSGDLTLVELCSKARKMKAELQSGDWLHPNDAGYKVMGEAIDLALFK